MGLESFSGGCAIIPDADATLDDRTFLSSINMAKVYKAIAPCHEVALSGRWCKSHPDLLFLAAKTKMSDSRNRRGARYGVAASEALEIGWVKRVS